MPFRFHPLYSIRLFLSLPPSRNSDPGLNSRLFSPLPTAVRALLYLSREDFSPFFSATRVELHGCVTVWRIYQNTCFPSLLALLAGFSCYTPVSIISF